MELTNYLTYAIALAIAAAIPGPGVLALVARAMGSGFWAALPMIFGLALGDVIYLTAAVLGLAAIATTFGTAFMVLKYAGAAYLAYMAYGMWRSGITTEKLTAKKVQGGWASFMAGLFVTLGNPKVMVFYLALLPTFLDLRLVDSAGLVTLIVLTMLVLVIVMTPYALAAGRARDMIQNPKLLRNVNRSAALCLGGAAVVIATRHN